MGGLFFPLSPFVVCAKISGKQQRQNMNLKASAQNSQHERNVAFCFGLKRSLRNKYGSIEF